MICEKCGLLLDGVDSEQVIERSKFSQEIDLCPRHADLEKQKEEIEMILGC